MSTLHPKFTVSIYKDSNFEYSEEPYEHNRKFAIYTPKPTSNPNSMLATIERFEAGLTTGKDFFARSYTSSFRQTKSLMSSPVQSPQRVQFKAEIDSEVAETQDISPSKLSSVSEESSRLKSKLQKDVELAKTLDTFEQKREINTKVGVQQDYEVQSHGLPSALSGLKAVSPSKTPKTWSKNVKTSAYGTSLFSQSQSSPLRKSLYYDPRVKVHSKVQTQAPQKNAVIENLLDNEGMISTKPELLDSIIKLRDMQLLKSNQPSLNKFKGIGKVDYVYNDFHTRSTNPGYSRNTAGAFYYR